MDEVTVIEIGDWVCWMYDQSFRYGRVGYIAKRVGGFRDIITDTGTIDSRYVLEVRKP